MFLCVLGVVWMFLPHLCQPEPPALVLFQPLSKQRYNHTPPSQLPDPDGLPDEEWPPIRDEIARRVAALVAELAPEDEEREL
mmetsp:Transcript_42089/g.68573  ORF Transcript_42089/g.68573 Transcript_42089/m.68573 type:complete len:82 (+) Transcript_42089:304-549(+)